jgi:hypothetical protein
MPQVTNVPFWSNPSTNEAPTAPFFIINGMGVGVIVNVLVGVLVMVAVGVDDLVNVGVWSSIANDCTTLLAGA